MCLKSKTGSPVAEKRLRAGFPIGDYDGYHQRKNVCLHTFLLIVLQEKDIYYLSLVTICELTFCLVSLAFMYFSSSFFISPRNILSMSKFEFPAYVMIGSYRFLSHGIGQLHNSFLYSF